MVDRPILFSAPMVNAIQTGRKSQTRRAWRVQPPAGTNVGWVPGQSTTPYGKEGDRLWVRETWTWNGGMVNCQKPHVTGEYHELYLTYAADGTRLTIKPQGFVRVPEQPPQREGEIYSLRDAPEDFRYTGENTYMDRLDRWWKRKIPAIHMPRWASRITLEITGVRVERLNAISEEDARAEGIDFDPGEGGVFWVPGLGCSSDTAADSFRKLWAAINGEESWSANPWVWVFDFKRVEA